MTASVVQRLSWWLAKRAQNVMHSSPFFGGSALAIKGGHTIG